MGLRVLYTDLFEILASNGVNSSSDLVPLDHEYMRLKSPERTDQFVEIESTRYPWATDVFECLAEHWDLLDDVGLFESGLTIKSAKPYDEGFRRLWNADDEIFAARASYACLFPNRVLFQSARFRSSGDGWCTVPLDFLTQLFALKPALLADMCVLMPPALREDDGMPGTRRHADKLRNDLWTERRLFDIRESGRGFRTLPKGGKWTADLAMAKTPWLFGLDLDTYCALASSEESFFLYSRAIDKLLGLPAESTTEVVKGVVEEVAAAVAAMNRTLDAERRSMRWKQGGLAIGAVSTAGSLFGPAMFGIIASLTGSATLVSAGLLLGERAKARFGTPADDYWLIWASQNK